MVSGKTKRLLPNVSENSERLLYYVSEKTKGVLVRHGASASGTEGPPVLAEDHRVGAFGVGKRQHLRKDVELVLVHRIDDRAYLFGFH